MMQRARKTGRLRRPKSAAQRRLKIENLERRLLLVSDWTNPFNARDVNNDGDVTPRDALIAINELARRADIPDGDVLPGQKDPDIPFVDVTGDGSLTPRDPLIVINGLERGFVPPIIDVGLVEDTAPDGQVNDDAVTSEAAISGGFQEQGSRVSELTLSIDDAEPVTIDVLESNTFRFDPRLATDGSDDGMHRVRVTAFDPSNILMGATEFSFELDTVSPPIPDSFFLGEETDSGDASDDGLTNLTQVTFAGTSESGTSVSLLLDGLDRGTTDSDGGWSFDVDALPTGLVSVQVTAQDMAGNESGLTDDLFVEFDRTPPQAVAAESINAGAGISVFFDDELGADASDLARFSLVDSSQQEIAVVGATVNGGQLNLVPDSPLAAGESYALTISPGIVDLAGNATQQTATFTLANSASLLIDSLSPRDGEDSVAHTREFIVRFTEAIDPATITSDSVKVTSLGGQVAGRLAVSSTEKFATFFPSEPWTASTQIRVELDGNTIRGRSGELLDVDRDGTPGGMRTIEFRTLPLTQIPGTNLFGFIYDAYTQLPIENATVRVDGLPELNAVTDAQGRFELVDVPAPEFFVHIDGTTAVNTPAGVGYPNVGKPFHSVPGQAVQLNHHGHVFDIYLPQMSDGDVQDLSPTETTLVGFGDAGKQELAQMLPGVDAAEWDKLQVTFFPGSAQTDDGTPATQATVIPVPPERLPAPLPEGFDPSLVISIQAIGANNFDLPAPITFPNLENMPLGSEPTIWSFDHDRGVFAPLGTGTVVDDGNGGTIIQSNPGVGILAPGWHFVSPSLYWAGNGDEPVGNGTLGVDIDPGDNDNSVEARVYLLADRYNTEHPQDTYEFRFFPPPGPEDLSDTGHVLSAETTVRRNSTIKITNVEWFRRLYSLNPEFDDALGPNGIVSYTLEPGSQSKLLRARLRPLSDVLRDIENEFGEFSEYLSNNSIFASRITVQEETHVYDPKTGARDTAVSVKDKVPIVLLDIADEKTDGQVKMISIHAGASALTEKRFLTLGDYGVSITASVASAKKPSDPAPPVFQVIYTHNGFSVQVLPNDTLGDPGVRQANLEFEVKLANAGGNQGVTKLEVDETFTPRVQVHITPVRTMYLDKESFKNAIEPFSNDAEADYQFVKNDLQQKIDRVGVGYDGVRLVDQACGSCEDRGDIRIIWHRDRSPENPDRHGLSSHVRFSTKNLGKLFKPSFDFSEFVVDDSIPIGRRAYLLDSAFNPNRAFLDNEVQIHIPPHFDSPAVRGPDAPKKDIAVTLMHEMLHLMGIPHLDPTGVHVRDLMAAGAQSPSVFSPITYRSTRLALDEGEGFIDPLSAKRIAEIVELYAIGLTNDPNSMYFPDSREEHERLALDGHHDVDDPSILLVTDDGFLFEAAAGDLGSVIADGPTGELFSQTFLLENYSEETLTITSIGLSQGGSDRTFSGLEINDELQPMEVRELIVQVDPSVAGEIVDSLVVTGTLPSLTEPLQTEFAFRVDAISTDASAEVNVLIDNTNFGGIEVGGQSEFQAAIEITNHGAADLVLDPSIVGDGTDVVFADPASIMLPIATGQSRVVELAFAPTELGLRPTTVQLSTNDPLNPLIELPVTGTGIPVGGVGIDDFDWGNDYVQIIDGPLVNRLVTDSGGNFEVGVSTNSEYTILVFDPESGLIARQTKPSGVSGGFGDASIALKFVASVAADQDGDGLPDDIEETIGTSLALTDTDADTLDDFAEIRQGLNPLEGLVFPTGVVGSVDLPGESMEVELRATEDGKRIAYVATGSHGLAIVDTTEIANPVILGLLDLDGTATDIAIDDATSRAVLATGTVSLQLVDVSDPMLPTLLETIPNSGPRLEVHAGLAYVANASGISIIDLATGETIEDILLGTGVVTEVAIEAPMVYTMDSERTLRILQMDNLSLEQRSTIQLDEGGGQMFVADGIVYAAASPSFFRGGFSTVDVSNPDQPTLISGSDIEGPMVSLGTAVAASGSGLGAVVGTPDATQNHAIKIVDLADLTETNVTVAEFPLPSAPTALSLSGGAAFVASEAGLQIVNYQPFDNLGVPPEVTVTATVPDALPNTAGMQIVEGTTIPVQVAVTDDVQVRELQLLVNNQVVQRDIDYPWQLSTVAMRLPDDDSLSIRVRAVDTGGNEATSNELIYQVIEDVIAPTITSQSPSDGASGEPGIQVVRFEFSEPMDVTTINTDTLRLRNTDGTEITPTDIRFRSDDTRLQLSYPALDLGSYELIIDAENISDRAGNPLGDQTIVSGFTLEVADTLGVYPNRILDTPEEPRGVTVADFNGDGIGDIATANYVDSSVSIFLGDGAGFPTRVDLPTTVRARWANSVFTEDLNADNKVDLVVIGQGGEVVTFIGNGDGTFADPVVHPTRASSPKTVAFEDFDNDTHLDILVYRGSFSALLLGEGDGTFTAQDLTLAGFAGVAVGDFDGDQNIDIVTDGSTRYEFFAGNGDGTFAEKVTTTTVFPVNPETLVAGHFNDDDHLDFASSNARTFNIESVSVFLGNGDGSFQVPASLQVPNFIDQLIGEDVNDDGITDLFGASNIGRDEGSVTSIVSNVGGQFQTTTFTSSDANKQLALGDINQDGIADLITPNSDDDLIQIQLAAAPGQFASSKLTVIGDLNNAGGEVATALLETNGDLIEDLVVASTFPASVAILRGLGDGTFGGRVEITVPRPDGGFATGDVNRDGLSDIVTASQNGDNATVLLADGTGGFSATTYAAGDAPERLVMGDVTGDGWPDLVTHTFLNTVHLIENRGDGTFLNQRPLIARPDLASFVLADLNGDGQDDMIAFEQSSDPDARVVVLLASASNTFVENQTVVVPRASSLDVRMFADDIDGDGRLDIAYMHGGLNSEPIVLFGVGDGTLQSPTPVPTTDGHRFLVVRDLDRDGKADIVTGDGLTVNVIPGTDDRTFEGVAFRNGKLNQRTTFEKIFLFAGDADGDGDIDLANLRVNSVRVLLRGGKTGFGDGAPVGGLQAGVGEGEFVTDFLSPVSPDVRESTHESDAISEPAVLSPDSETSDDNWNTSPFAAVNPQADALTAVTQEMEDSPGLDPEDIERVLNQLVVQTSR